MKTTSYSSENGLDELSEHEKLISSEIRYRRLFETAKDGILILDAETGMIKDVNPFLIELLGYSKEQFIEKEIWEIGFFKDVVANKEKFLELQNQEYVRYEDLPLETSLGNQINVEFVSNVYLVDKHKVIQCNIRDITKRKHDEINLKISEKKYRNIFENAQEGIFQTDLRGAYIAVNPALAKMYGYDSPDELINSRPDISNDSYYNPDERKNFLRMIEKHGFVKGYEYEVKHKNGHKLWFYEDARSIISDIDGIIYFEGFVIDITKRKRAEKELIIAKEKAEESDKLKTSFLQNMSHEIRTPLNGIIGFSELLNTENLSKEEVEDYTSMINKCGTRLIEIVDNVLDISKIQTGQVKIELNPISVSSFVTDIISYFYPIANSKYLKLNFNNEHYEKRLVIYSDESKLYQIFTNLINNALKFTKSGHIIIGYEIVNNDLQFYVKDTGIGIPAELHDKIFDRFTQVEQSSTRNYEGAGLGLAICKGLVILLGGSIWVESEINKGSTFFFTIPYKQVSLQ